MTDIRLTYVTTKDLAEARSLATTLLDRKLIACANILPQMESIYRWEGKIEHNQETVLILKTEQRLAARVIASIEELHSYSVPCALSLTVERGSLPYLDWLKGEVKSSP